ncbi:MAG: hypothetical protein LC802_18185 [Acidobacteria bacterium]|nr:hypothetical protein [Acidobacteriota bacterium]
MLANDVLHPGRELITVAILLGAEAEALADEVALQSAAGAVDEGKAQAVARRRGALGRRRDIAVTKQDGEVVSDLLGIRHARFGKRVGALEVEAEVELADEGRRDGRVQAEGVVRAAGLDNAAEAVRVGTEAGATEQEAFLLREVAEGREGKEVALVDVPGNLARVEGGRDLVLDLVEECLGQEEVLAALWIERGEEGQLLAPDPPKAGSETPTPSRM